MQAILSYDQSPPLAAPLRFFLTAPVFGILAGLLLLWSGAEVFATRWAPATLALTHLITTGFMLQAMLGAMLQILPVVAGANMSSPTRLAGSVHALLTLAALFLTAAFMSFSPHWFKVSAIFFGAGVAVFVGSALRAYRGVPSTSATVRGLKLALLGLSVTVVLGIVLAAVLGWSLSLPLMELADVHLAWGFMAWGMALLASVAYVVVPMFQLTPAYPPRLERWLALALLLLTVLWSLVYLGGGSALATAPGLLLVAGGAWFAIATLRLQRRSKRQRFDASQRGWRVAMGSVLAATAVWTAALIIPTVGDWPGWPLLCGVFVLFGVFLSVVIGMLYKIVPFLVWLHLQNEGQGQGKARVPAPNMKKIIAEAQMDRQMRAHFVSCALLVLAVFWPEWFARPSGLALIVAQGWLLHNLLSAASVHRRHLQKIAAVRAEQATP